jgi:hypothetical protein
VTQNSLFEAPIISFDPQGTVLFYLQRSRLGETRKLDLTKLSGVPPELQQELVHATASIMACKELTDIYKLDGTYDRWLAGKVLPSIFRKGIYVVGKTGVAAIDERTSIYRGERDDLVPKFLVRYDDIVSANKAKLGARLAQAVRWPTRREVETLFFMRWRWIGIQTPVDALRSVNPDIAAREQERLREDMREQEELIKDALAVGLKSVVDRMVDRLTPDPQTGRKKVFRDSLVENFREFLEAFPSRYVVEDKTIEALVNRANVLLSGISPEDLRKAPGLADSIRTGMETIKEQLDPIVAGTRSITFEEEEVPV